MTLSQAAAWAVRSPGISLQQWSANVTSILRWIIAQFTASLGSQVDCSFSRQFLVV